MKEKKVEIKKVEFTYESMSQFVIPSGHQMRVWRKTTNQYDDVEANKTQAECLGILKHLAEPLIGSNIQRYIAEALVVLPGVTAVECLDEDGRGIIVYKNWPSGDE